MQKSRHRPVEVAPRIFAFPDRVGASWIGHHRKSLVILYEFVDQSQIGLVVTIVVRSTVDNQKVSLQILNEVDR